MEFIKMMLLYTHDAADIAIYSLQQSKKKIYIFGAGIAGTLVKQSLERFNVSIYRFVDNDINKIGTTIGNVPVMGFSDLCSDDNRVVVIGTVAFHHELVQQCLEAGISTNDICFADFLHYGGKDVTRNYFCDNIESVLEIYNHCVDEESQKLFVANMLYQINRDRRNYRCKLSQLSSQYFDPEIINIDDQDVYFDCGAKDGDTVIGFHKFTQGRYKKILAFEPDAKNFKALVNNTVSYKNIHNINAGVGEFEEQLLFEGNRGGHSSFSNAIGNMKASIVPLDKLINEQPTFIKMDIEGFELRALLGAKEILQSLKPKLAICLYHKPCDIIELPKYILSQRRDYKLYIRLYRDFGHDLVCYCI